MVEDRSGREVAEDRSGCSGHVARCNKSIMNIKYNYYVLFYRPKWQMAATGFGADTEPAAIICEIPNSAYLYSPP